VPDLTGLPADQAYQLGQLTAELIAAAEERGRAQGWHEAITALRGDQPPVLWAGGVRAGKTRHLYAEYLAQLAPPIVLATGTTTSGLKYRVEVDNDA